MQFIQRSYNSKKGALWIASGCLYMAGCPFLCSETPTVFERKNDFAVVCVRERFGFRWHTDTTYNPTIKRVCNQ